MVRVSCISGSCSAPGRCTRVLGARPSARSIRHRPPRWSPLLAPYCLHLLKLPALAQVARLPCCTGGRPPFLIPSKWTCPSVSHVWAEHVAIHAYTTPSLPGLSGPLRLCGPVSGWRAPTPPVPPGNVGTGTEESPAFTGRS